MLEFFKEFVFYFGLWLCGLGAGLGCALVQPAGILIVVIGGLIMAIGGIIREQ